MNRRVIIGSIMGVFAVIAIIVAALAQASIKKIGVETESGSGVDSSRITNDSSASGGQYVSLGGGDSVHPNYDAHLSLIKSQSVRNRNHDNSPFLNTPMSELPIADNSPLLGPRSEYTNIFPHEEWAFPIPEGGQNRTACEFSHFGYDDPILFPNQPGKAHLHMFFGNTDANAYTTYKTLANSGSSTCNGQELNRTGYWAPAMIDGQGNVRIPERVVVYYKGETLANAARACTNTSVCDLTKPAGSNVYEPGMANISPIGLSVPEVPNGSGGAPGQLNFKCSNNFSGNFGGDVERIPSCAGNGAGYPGTRTVLEMEVKFWHCFDANADVADWRGWVPAGEGRGDWFYGNCNGHGGGSPSDNKIYPHLSYFVNYVVMPGENTNNWFLSSDVDPATIGSNNPQLVGAPGGTHHGDWWGGWHPEINKEWIDNCVNFKDPSGARSGCGFGYLSDGGPDQRNPRPGRALKFRPQFDAVGNANDYRVPLAQIFNELCQPLGPAHSYNASNPRSGAYCKP